MKIVQSFLLIPTIVFLCSAQYVTISGVVQDSAGVGIAGANVRLGVRNISTATGPDGNFVLTNTTRARYPGKSTDFNAPYPFVRSDRYLYFSLTEETKVEAAIYDVSGKLIGSLRETATPGNHAMALPRLAPGIHIFQVVINEGRYTFKGITRSAADAIRDHAVPAKPAKISSRIDDAVIAAKEGYQLSRCAVANPDTSGIRMTLIPCVTGTVTDVDGNTYGTIKIGGQIWMSENLRTTKYNDNTPIDSVTGVTAWINHAVGAGAYCFYQDSIAPAYRKKWGALYNWYAVNTGKLAPTGWHVPTKTDWKALENCLIAGGYNYDGMTTANVAGKAVSSKTDWTTITTYGAVGSNLSTNNSSGFSALPGGKCSNGAFYFRGSYGYWWSATADGSDTSFAYHRYLTYNSSALNDAIETKNAGFSVRLVKDN